MQSSNRKKSSVKKNINYKLSKEAIIFLDNQLVNSNRIYFSNNICNQKFR